MNTVDFMQAHALLREQGYTHMQAFQKLLGDSHPAAQMLAAKATVQEAYKAAGYTDVNYLDTWLTFLPDTPQSLHQARSYHLALSPDKAQGTSIFNFVAILGVIFTVAGFYTHGILGVATGVLALPVLLAPRLSRPQHSSQDTQALVACIAAKTHGVDASSFLQALSLNPVTLPPQFEALVPSRAWEIVLQAQMPHPNNSALVASVVPLVMLTSICLALFSIALSL